MKQLAINTTLFCGLSAFANTSNAENLNSSLSQNEENPNLLIFIADDCTFLDIGCYGSLDSKTPNIDNFAKEGMRFERAFQAAPMSSPTRHNLYTGIWPVKSGAYPNHTFAKDGTKSIVHHMHTAGYKVALIGKSHVSPKTVFPFDVYVNLDNNNDLNHTAIQQFINDCKNSNTPFCLIVASNQPHSPWNKGDATQFDQEKITLPPSYVDTKLTRKLFSDYLAEINYMDNEFGQVLKVLDNNKIKDNTAVFFLSEQGNSFPFAKWTCYDVGVHSACIVRWPGKVKANTTSNAIVEYVDIVPTFVDMTKAKLVEPVDGKSFKKVLEGKAKTHKQYTFSLQTTRGIIMGAPHYGIRSVSNGKYRYIVNLDPEARFKNAATKSKQFEDWKKKAENNTDAKIIVEKYQVRPAFELYDIENDPYCIHNIYGTKNTAKITKQLAKVLQEWMDDCGDLGQETEMQALKHMNQRKNTAKKKK